MKFISQFGILLFFSFLGELLNRLLPLPIPASIYGIILLFFSLQFKIIPLKAIKETSDFMIEIMPIMFIPAAVGLLAVWDVIRLSWLQYLIITFISTVIVMGASGFITQAFIRHSHRKEGSVHE